MSGEMLRGVIVRRMSEGINMEQYSADVRGNIRGVIVRGNVSGSCHEGIFGRCAGKCSGE